MKHYKLVACLLCALGALSFPRTASAVDVEITGENVGRLSTTTNNELGSVACYVSGSGNIVGNIIDRIGAAGSPAPGNLFSSLNPSIAERIAKERTQYNKLSRKHAREKRKPAKKKIRKKLNTVSRKMVTIQAAQSWCDIQWYPGSGGNPPYYYPTPEPEDEPFIEADTGPTHAVAGSRVAGELRGAGSSLVTLGNDRWLRTVESSGSFAFDNVPAGTYFLHAESPGVSFGPSATINVAGAPTASDPAIVLEARQIPVRGFRFAWKDEKLSRAGHEYYAQAPEYSAGSIQAASVASATDTSAEQALSSDYKITLSDEQMVWSQEFSDRLLKTMKSVWEDNFPAFPISDESTWVLTESNIQDDIAIVTENGAMKVTIHSGAFANADPQSITIDGERGVFFSRRLYKAVARFVTKEGRDTGAVETILQWKYNATTIIPEYYNITYWSTRESADNFQQFTPSELMWILATFAELPAGLARSDYNLRLIRRKNSIPHPTCPRTPAVAWLGTQPWQSYIEFMPEAFYTHPLKTYRTIVGARAGILWQQKMTAGLRNEWIQIGGWVYDPLSDSWYTTKPTEAGPEIIADANPGPLKDFMSAIAEYITAPEQLRYRAPDKFEFIRRKIMSGYRYYQQIREDLRWEVLNLRPDYSYPGKIKSVQISVRGKSTEDKHVTIDLELEGTDLMADGAKYGYTTIYNSRSNARMGIGFNAVDADPQTGLSFRFRAQFIIGKHAASGPWDSAYISMVDGVGNTRIQNRDSYGWKLFIINALEVLEEPVIIPGSGTIEIGETEVDGRITPQFIASVRLRNPSTLRYLCLDLRGIDNTMHEVGGCAFASPDAGDRVTVKLPFLSSMPSDRYGIIRVMLASIGENYRYTMFSTLPKPDEEQMPLIDWVSPHPDMVAPELDLNAISVSSQTVHPESPDGETVVTIGMKARDDDSGIRYMGFCLKSPLDQYKCESFKLWNIPFFPIDADRGVWKQYQETFVLPRGTAPGTWGVSSAWLEDRAGNRIYHNFTETIHFEVDSEQSF